jgi:hypothetical protein
VMAAILADENEIGTGALEIRREQELRVGDNDVAGMGGIKRDYGSRRSVTTVSSKRSSHSPLPVERDKDPPSCQQFAQPP